MYVVPDAPPTSLPAAHQPPGRCPQAARPVHRAGPGLSPELLLSHGRWVPFRRGVRLALLVTTCWLVGLAVGAPGWAAQWVSPLAGEPQVTRPFDPPATPYGSGHRGVDLASTPGAVVGAAGAGTIGYAAPLAGRGVVTVLHDGGLRTTYEPVTASVVAGQSVAAGQPIGSLETGHSGCPVAACLHWGLLRGEVYLDPMSLLRVGPVRLLPRADAASRSSDGPPVADAVRDGPSGSRAGPLGGVPPGPGPALGPVTAAGAGAVLGGGLLALRRRAPP